MATTERSAKDGRMCEVFARWLTLAGALFISGCTSDGPAPPPAGSGSCLAAYDDDFDPAALLGSWAQPPCEGESEATCLYESLDVGDIERCYQVTVPSASASSPLPIVLMWHGSDSNGASFRSNMNDDFADLHFEQTVADGALVVYPSGLAHADCNGTSCWDRDPTGRDIAFFDALAPRLAEAHGGDPSRVVAVGHSRGGRFVEVLGCHRADKLSAVAQLSAGDNNVASCPGSVPIWLNHSELDSTIDFSEGETHLENWAQRNGCAPVDGQSFAVDVCHDLTGCSEPVRWCPTREDQWDGHAPSDLADDALWAFLSAHIGG